MYYYVEYLRAMRAFRIVGIILGVLLLIGIIFRLSFINHGSPERYISDLQNSPTAHVTKTQLPDGGVRTVIDDPQKRVHAVILRNGSHFSMDVTEPTSTKRAHDEFRAMNGSLNVSEDTHGGVSRVRIAYEGRPDISWNAFFTISVMMGLIVATLLAAPLAKENEGHLELAWTKPVSREKYAGATFAIDAAAIVLSQLACIAIALICIWMWTVPIVTLGSGGWPVIALALIVPIAWYACLTAFSASVKRGPGMVIGMGWFAALVIPSVMAATSHAQSLVGQWIHAIFTGLAYIDPIVYVPSFHGHRFSGSLVDSAGTGLTIAVILAVVYIALAVLQWRRVEA
jgi:hypothetical protein